jgi:hypothetical protein
VTVLDDCLTAIRRERLLRERAAIQEQLDRLLEQGGPSDDRRINELGARRIGLKQELEALH